MSLTAGYMLKSRQWDVELIDDDDDDDGLLFLVVAYKSSAPVTGKQLCVSCIFFFETLIRSRVHSCFA